MTKILAIVQTNVIRTLRDRLGLFFLVLLPMLLIVVLGIMYGGQGTAVVGLVDADRGALATELTAGLGDGSGLRIEVREYGSVADLQDAAARGFVQVGLAIPAGYDQALRTGSDPIVTLVAPPTEAASAIRAIVDRAIADQAALIRAARFVASPTVTFDQALAQARASRDAAPGVGVTVESVAEVTTVRGFDVGAQSQLILFMFLTALTGATELITSRQLGISRRMFATPTGAWTIIAGEGLGRVVLAMLQGALIVVGSAVLFGVNWVDPAATTAIVVVFAFVAGGAALLIGTVASNASQAGALGPALGMLLGLLGGTMVPAEVFPEAMRTLSHVTPHAWAMDAFRTMLLRGGGLADILGPLAVLAGFAAVLLTLAVVRFRRVTLAGA
jgi:linearmycin/streptolysin S transport system permease protein